MPYVGGNLVPLPIPRRPWSHLGIDFVMDIPVSEGNTCILVAVDRFSKACKLIPLRGLPTALETAEHLFHQVFRNFGVPEEIVSDHGPQIISRVWKAFFRLLGVSVSLSSGYHSQTNGQAEHKIHEHKMQELGRYLRAYCQEDQFSWSRFLPWAEYAQYSPPASLPSSAYSATNHRSSLGWESLRRFQLLTTGSGRARDCRTRPTSTSSGQCGDTRPSEMLGMPQLPSINLETGCS